MSKKRGFWRWLIVAAPILLVLLPVLGGQTQDEMARWHLAAAANSLKLNNEDFEANLRKAAEKSKDLGGLRDYWLLRVMQALEQSPESLPELVAEAMEKNRSFAGVGLYAGQQLESQARFALAVKVMESSLTPANRKNVNNLNFLAYIRSLAGIELEQALEDINQVLDEYPNIPEFRDTRAWVLFQMGKPVEALEDANFAVQKLETRSAWPAWASFMGEVEGLAKELEEKLGGVSRSSSDETVLNESEVPMDVWRDAVVRYHRARILESLGRIDESEEDFDWLRERRLPIDDTVN